MQLYPLLYGTDTPATLFMVVYMYYYVRHFLDESFRLNWWHYGPGVIFLIAILSSNTLLDAKGVYSFWYGEMKRSGYYFALALFTWLQNLAYYISSVYILYRSFDFKGFYKNPLFYIGLCFIFACFVVFSSFSSYVSDSQGMQRVAWVAVSLISTIVYFLAIIFPSLVGEPDALGKFASPEKKYGKMKLPEEMASDYLKKVQKAMEVDHLYQNAEVNLKKFALMVDIPPHYVSQVINRRLNKTFSDYLNECRVNAARESLKKPENADVSILRIAYEVGFNSKASFNKIFKRITGSTPSAYRKEG